MRDQNEVGTRGSGRKRLLNDSLCVFLTFDMLLGIVWLIESEGSALRKEKREKNREVRELSLIPDKPCGPSDREEVLGRERKHE